MSMTKERQRRLIFAIWDLDILTKKFRINAHNRGEWDKKFSAVLAILKEPNVKNKKQKSDYGK